VEWPIYRESKEYQEAKKAKAREAIAKEMATLRRAPSNTRSKLVSFDTVYAPTKTQYGRTPLYLIYDAAIIDALLELYPGASYNLYSQIVTQWGTPDCQVVIKQFESELVERHIFGPAFLLKMMYSESNGDDWKRQESLMCDFVKRCCNRQAILKKGKVELQFETSPFLAIALILRTLGEHLKLSFDDFNVYRGEVKGIKERGKHSRRWDKIVKRFKQAGLELIYGDNIRETARLWVRARVLRTDTIEQFAVKEGISKKNLLDRLDPFDKAMGHVRQPG
jgi:hypothetical protein